MQGNMANLMKQAQKMQRQMEEQAKELEAKEFTATAGGGAVEVTVSGKREVLKVKLAERSRDTDDIEMLEDLIVAAANEALRKVDEDVTVRCAETDRRIRRRCRECFNPDRGEAEWIIAGDQMSRLIRSFTSSGSWCKVRAETGIPYHQYAERSGGESGKVHCGCEKQCEILCTVLYIDRSGSFVRSAVIRTEISGPSW